MRNRCGCQWNGCPDCDDYYDWLESIDDESDPDVDEPDNDPPPEDGDRAAADFFSERSNMLERTKYLNP